MTVLLELDAFPADQRTAHFPGAHVSKHVSNPHEGRVPKERRRDQWPRRGTGKCSSLGTCGPATIWKSHWERSLAGKTHDHGQVLLRGIRPALYLEC